MNKSEVEVIATMKQRVDDIDKKLVTHCQNQREDFDKVFKKIDSVSTKMDELNRKFAGKWVEKISIGLIITVIGGLLMILFQGGL